MKQTIFLFSFLCFVQLCIPVNAAMNGKVQAKLAYLDIITNNRTAAKQRIPVPNHLRKASAEHANVSDSHPTLDFARQIWKYGEKQLAIEALEYYTEGDISIEKANTYWLEFGEYFLKAGQIPSAEYCLNTLRIPVGKHLLERFYLLKTSILLHKYKTSEVEKILNKRWKGRSYDKTYQRFNLASALLDKGDFANASKNFEKMHKEMPKDMPIIEKSTLKQAAKLRLGYAFLTENKLQKSKDTLSNIPLDSIYANKSALGLAWADLGLGELNQALAPLSHIIKTNKNYSLEKQEALALIPVVTSQQGLYGRSIRHYEQAMSIYQSEITFLENAQSKPDLLYILNALEKAQDDENQFKLKEMTTSLSPRVLSYLYSLLENTSFQWQVKSLSNQKNLLNELSKWHQNKLLKKDSFQRLSLLLQGHIREKKVQSLNRISIEFEEHTKKLNQFIADTQFAIAKMYDLSSNQ